MSQNNNGLVGGKMLLVIFGFLIFVLIGTIIYTNRFSIAGRLSNTTDKNLSVDEKYPVTVYPTKAEVDKPKTTTTPSPTLGDLDPTGKKDEASLDTAFGESEATDNFDDIIQ